MTAQTAMSNKNATHEAALLDALAMGSAAIAGMTPAMIDRRALRHTLKQRMATLRVMDAAAYLEIYRADAAEQAAFLEGVLIGETSFFRDAAVFGELLRWCLSWFTRHQRPMRILSAPCSTGEEPYSIAITLQQAGVAPDRFMIDALDISAAAIEQAKEAVYKGFSLRNIPKPEQASFLKAHGDGWRVVDALRERVHFRQANLMDVQTLSSQHYDLICSRNLLIYQSPKARRIIAEALANALVPEGRLVVGAADWGRDLDDFFQLEEPIHSFALRRRSIDPATANSAKKISPKALKSKVKVTPKQAIAASLTASDLLADVSGLYRKALQAYLCGDEREAERLCRQTLYLEENHVPTLELLSKIHRPHVTPRMKLALRARLQRHRDAMAHEEAR